MGQEAAPAAIMITPKFKAKAPTGTGIWTPKSQTPSSSINDLHEIQSTKINSAPPTPPPPPAHPVWTPQPSPTAGRKEFRPVRFESPTLPRRYVVQQSTPNGNAQLPPWSCQSNSSSYAPPSPRSTNSCTNLSTPTTVCSSSTHFIDTYNDTTDFTSNFAPNTSVSDKIKTFERSASASELYRPFVRRQPDTSRPAYRPNEVNDYVIRYKCQRARAPHKSNGYLSEPEPNYDSDYSTIKYRTLDRRRLQSVSSAANVRSNANYLYDDKSYGTMPNPVKSGQNSYKNQPGRIENYVTGNSSVSEKEHKEWWDEVMDIFNGHLDQTKLSPHYTEGNLSRALAKESGYTSDSNLVFRKKEVIQGSPLSPVEQKQAYKSLQAGGEPPLLGFRKPAPEKPKDSDNNSPVPPPLPTKGIPLSESPNRYYESDVNIHFKTPVRHEFKQSLSEDELAIRQAEHMQKLYQEERRRKYLQELQDMNSRRHTDNFTPTQKSPISLNRYDDFQSDLAPKPPSTAYMKAVAKALYNFQGQGARELTFKKGDIIYIRRKIDANWYEGEHNAMIGLLPANYIEIINKEDTRRPQRKPSEGQARAKFNFQAQSSLELSLNKGELVTLTRRVDDNWFEGKIANRKGIFPVSYVEVLTDIGAEDIAAKTVITEQSVTNLRPSLDTLRTNINHEFNVLTQNGNQPPNGILKETKNLHKTDLLHVDTVTEQLKYRALYKYRPQNSDELELLEGDIVHVLEKCDDGWFVGTSQRTGCFGTFPGNYVERL
ncbi:sorbin and SH3 domain-containing protein 1 isoform X7 [Teleopsis dalmanni]|uniref:sorbin and SH3 domain-containing protein 1 isoform X7 n=1 Tax=Teleopsis dalmanni TaxID=139649 RepID=UPI0018CF7440|nr:sorbin and SH3 domain-containing protein 1 isoform X7 [Teleopsis dalmanni]